MKKQVLSTSVIALGVALAAPASAQDWDVSWGGYYSQHIGFADVGGTVGSVTVDNDGLGFHQTSEIIFSPSVTLDNGLTFGVNIQLEGENVGGQIDETYMTISGDSLGTIIIGSEDSAGYKSMVAAPEVTSMYINSPSYSAFIPLTASTGGILPGAFRGAAISAYTEVGRNNDVNRITYFTPDFSGLTLGVSYARNNGGNAVNNHNNNLAASIEDIFDLGVNYSGTFGTTTVSLGARWGTGDQTAPGAGSVDTWGVGAQVGFGGFTIGGHYAENDNGTLAPDQSGWSFGASYDAAGPWSFEALTMQGEVDLGGGAHIDQTVYKIGARRDMGPGVSWDIYALMAETDANFAAGTEVDGTLIGTAINLSF